MTMIVFMYWKQEFVMKQRARRSPSTRKPPKEKKEPAKFRMRGKPPEPRRATYSKTITIDSGDTLGRIVEIAESIGLPFDEMSFEVDHDFDRWGCEYHARLYYQEPETDEHWEGRLATYRKRLASWEAWADEHQEEIEAHLAAKAQEKKDKQARIRERSIKSLKKEKKIIEKRLETLEQRLRK
jgi:hypothetical protein